MVLIVCVLWHNRVFIEDPAVAKQAVAFIGARRERLGAIVGFYTPEGGRGLEASSTRAVARQGGLARSWLGTGNVNTQVGCVISVRSTAACF